MLDEHQRSEFLFRDRLGLSARDGHLVAEGPAAPPAPAVSAFASAWRNYIKSVLKKGFMYIISCSPSVILYISENKTLAGKEDRTYEKEALGRKLVVSFFEKKEGLVHRVDKSTMGLKQHLLSCAEILQQIGGVVLPADPERTAAATEMLLEAHYQNLEITRYEPHVEPGAGQVHVYSLGDESPAEEALALELAPDQRTKMVLVRCLQRNDLLGDEETLQTSWQLPLADLQARAAPLLPVPAAPAAPAIAARGRGRGRGRGAAPAAAAPAAPAARGGRGGRRGRGRG